MSNILSDFNSRNKSAENIARSKVYSDLHLSLIANPITGDITPLSDIDAVKNSIKHLVLTNFFERPFEPALASGVTSLLFENANQYTAMEIENAILKVIANHEPRVTDVSCDVEDDSDRNAYRVTISYRVYYNNRNEDIEFYLTRLR